MNRRYSWFLVVALSVLVLPPATAGAATVTWISNVSGYWDDGANWSTGSAPQAGDDVIIDRPGVTITVTILSPTATISTLLTTEFLDVNSTLTVTNTAFLDGGSRLSGTLDGGGTITLRSAGEWSFASVLNVNVAVGAGHTLTLTGFTYQLFGATLTNQGTVTWTQGTITLNNSSHLVNAGGALWDAQGDLFVSTDSNGPHTFTNAGTLRKSGGAGSFMLSGTTTTNTGTLQIQTGQFACFCTGFSTSGILNVSAGATIDLNSAVLQAGSTFAGNGTLVMGNTTVAASLTVTLPVALTGVLTGSGTAVTFAAPVTWSGGTLININVILGAGQTLILDSLFGYQLFGATLTNQGTVTWTQGNISLASSSHLVNAGGALWDVQGDLYVTSDGNGPHTVTNAGTLRKSAGAGYFQLAGFLTATNSGSLQIQTGQFICSCIQLSTSGLLHASAGTMIDLSAVTLQAGSTFTGSGTLTVTGQTPVTLGASLTFTLPFVLAGGFNGGGHTLTLAAPMTWAGGSLSNVHLIIGAGRTLTLDNSFATYHFNGATLTNQGTFAWSDGVIHLNASSHIVNAPGAIWDVQGARTIFNNDLGPNSITNAGTLRFSGPIGWLDMQQIAFSNTGTLRVRLAAHSLGFDGSDFVRAPSAALGGTLDVVVLPGFVPVAHDRFQVVQYSSLSGGFTALNGNGSQYVMRHTEFSVWVKPVVAPGTELIRNGAFSDQLNFWRTFATPNMSYIAASVVNGGLEFYRVPPPAGQSNQATVFQETEVYLPAITPIAASFVLSNTSSVRKRISVLITDSDFSDLSVCTFWLPANSPPRTYGMRSHTTRIQWSVSLYFYAASAGSNGGAYRIDDVSMRHDPNVPSDRTDCLDPLAPGPAGGLDGPDLLINGNFNTGTLAPWFTFGTITSQIASGVFEFIKNGFTPAGVVAQFTGQAMATGQVLTTTLELGNSSSVRKRVTAIVHDRNFGDLAACTFWLPPGQPLSPYEIRSYATQPWTDAMVSVYPATNGLDEWTRLDNVTFRRTPSIGVAGTECLEPGANLTLVQGRPVHAPVPIGPSAMSASAPAATVAPATGPVTALSAATTLGPQTIWHRVLDLGATTNPTLAFESSLEGTGTTGLAQVSLNGVDWITIAEVSPASEWTTIDVDLSAFAGEIVQVRLVFDAPRRLPDTASDRWRVRNLRLRLN